jgi:signal transduction histidine kinase/CheY-like chemotaxis protein/AraC-like DNA-binding protein
VRQRDGLFDEVIHQILPDGAGRLWMSTNRGIFSVRADELDAFAEGRAARVHSTVYSERDGLRNREANGGYQPAGVRARDGRLWFPTQDGVAVVDPARVGRNPVPPPVVVERLVARDRPRSVGGAPAELGPAERDFQIEYTALSFVAPENVRFRYRLEGLDAGWVEAGARRTAFYTNVPPGAYTFRVVASNDAGVWNDRGAALAVHVVPRLHETLVARVLLALALALLGAATVWWRVRRLRGRARELARLVDQRTAELRDREAALARQNAQLAVQALRLTELDEAKSRLFANLSHEFRTPLTLILGPLRGLLDGRYGALGTEAHAQGALMQRNGQRLLRLINQILDLAKLQAGALALDRRPHDLVAIARDATLAFAPLAERRAVTLRFAARVEALVLPFDDGQLEKVLLNLLSNALKFTESGGSVDVEVRADGSGAELRVRDTGVGIAPDELPRIFDRFHQVDASATRRHEGTGIGLALARELVELHGGTIGVESAPGAGSSFVVRLPGPVAIMAVGDAAGGSFAAADLADAGAGTADRAAAKGAGPEAVAADEDRTTVLVVDDNADVRAYVRSVLAASYRVVEADDGPSGLAAAREALPDVIVADVMMPELDGLGLARALRDDAMTDAIPVVLLTARAAPEDQVAGMRAGADAYLVKPFDPAVLEATVAGLLAQRQRLRARFAAAGDDAAAPAAGAVAGEAPVAGGPAAAPEPSALVTRLRAIVAARLDDEGLTPEALAEAAGVSYHQLYRALRAERGESPSRFVRGVRCECADALLRRGAGSVTEVAYAVGFQSLSYFSRAFRERFGVAPGERLAGAGTRRQGVSST